MSEDFDIREVLAILSPSSISFACIPGTSPQKLTPHDVMARLRNASRPAQLLALGKYANIQEKADQYYWAFTVAASGLPQALRMTKTHHNKEFTKLVNLVLWEYFSPSACPWCRGKQSFTIVNDKIIPCGACSGTGNTVWTTRKRAELMCMSETTWQRVCSDLHYQMFRIIAGHEQEIIDALYERPQGQRLLDIAKRGDPEDYEPPPRAA